MELTPTVVALRVRLKEDMDPVLSEHIVPNGEGYVLIGPFTTFAEADEWMTQPGICEALTDDAEWEAVTVELREALDNWGDLVTTVVSDED